MSNLLDNYPDSFALVHIPVYQSDWAEARAVFYGQSITPTVWFDGRDERVGSYSSVSAQYIDYRDNYFLPRLAAATDISIALTGMEVSSGSYEITASICVEPTGGYRIVRLYMAQVIDHWPLSSDRNGFKQAAATEDLWVAPGACEQVERTFIFDGDSLTRLSDVKIVVWAQKTVADALTKPATVYQAAVMDWPFTPPELDGDLDGDGAVDLDDYDLFADCLSGPGVVTEPVGCDPGVFAEADFEGDGDVDLSDFGIFGGLLAGGF